MSSDPYDFDSGREYGREKGKTGPVVEAAATGLRGCTGGCAGDLDPEGTREWCGLEGGCLGESTPSSGRRGARSGDDGALGRLSSPDPSGSYGVLGVRAWRPPWLSGGCERVDAVVADG